MSAACAVCGAAFVVSRVGHRYCSMRCRQLAYRQRGGYGWAVCAVCGTEFARSAVRVRHCSLACGERGKRHPTLSRLLAILEQGRPFGTAELAHRLYGLAGHHERYAVRAAIYRLRQRGYRIETARCRRFEPTTYRLVRAEEAA